MLWLLLSLRNIKGKKKLLPLGFIVQATLESPMIFSVWSRKSTVLSGEKIGNRKRVGKGVKHVNAMVSLSKENPTWKGSRG